MELHKISDMKEKFDEEILDIYTDVGRLKNKLNASQNRVIQLEDKILSLERHPSDNERIIAMQEVIKEARRDREMPFKDELHETPSNIGERAFHADNPIGGEDD